MALPLINGVSYVYSQIVINIFGVPIAGVSAIKYTGKQEKTNNYGAGTYAVSRGRGRKEFNASITLEMAEVQAIIAAAPNRDILDIPPFDIVVAWVPSTGGVVTHVLKNCEFMEDPMESKEGDTGTNLELPLILSHIIK